MVMPLTIKEPLRTQEALTIKELTDAVGGGLTPRMVRHYHQLGLLPPPARSPSNYRLYTEPDVQRLKRIVALKQQGFQLSHIQQLLEGVPHADQTPTLIQQLQRQYQTVLRQMTQLRHTALALEGLLGRDHYCQDVQAEVLAQIKQLDADSQANLGELTQLWHDLDAPVHQHPETFQESLERLLPDLSQFSEIDRDLLSNLVLACGDVSIAPFVRRSADAIAAGQQALSSGCQVIVDISAVASALDQTRLANLGCAITVLIEDPHVHNAPAAEQCFWQQGPGAVAKIPAGSIVIVGYAPSVLLAINRAIAQQQIAPALVIGLPIGFSHAPAAKRQLIHSPIPYITLEGTVGGGMLAATVLNTLAESLLTRPDCHCHLAGLGASG